MILMMPNDLIEGSSVGKSDENLIVLIVVESMSDN